MGRCAVNETLEVGLVTLVALAALLVLVRSYLPSREGPPKAPGCSNCASSTRASARQGTTGAPTRPPAR
jgi:hypothetical protein